MRFELGFSASEGTKPNVRKCDIGIVFKIIESGRAVQGVRFPRHKSLRRQGFESLLHHSRLSTIICRTIFVVSSSSKNGKKKKNVMFVFIIYSPVVG